MAFYDFVCVKCHHSFEVKMSIAERSKGEAITCPSCHSRETKQIFSPTGYIRSRKKPSTTCPHKGGCGGHCPL